MTTMPTTDAPRPRPSMPMPLQMPIPLRRRAVGQAMVEFLVAAIFFLGPLLLAVIALGKLADVRHTTLMAARYAAWERTVWYDDAGSKFNGINGENQKSAAQINSEVAVRLINDHTSATGVIRNTDRNATGYANGIDPMWHDFSHHAFLDRYDQQGTSIAQQAPQNDYAGEAVAAIEAVPLPSGVTGTLVPPVPTGTMAVANVALRRIAYNSAAFQRLWPRDGVWMQDWAGLDFSAPGAILSNTWSANGSGATHAMVAQSMPTAMGLGTAVGTVVNAAKTAWDPLSPSIDFGKIAPDVVPADRLKN
jgi:hypothetical protein